MSSATSIKRLDRIRVKEAVKDAGAPTRPSGPAGMDAPADAGFRPWHFFVLASLMAATVAVIMSRQSTPEHLVLISLTIAAAGLAAAGFYRMLAPLAIDDPLLYSEPLSERTRAALEREKALTLRSIKELEFDRAMGKVSERDFDEMAARLRARAVTLMKSVEDSTSGYRELIERDLKARLSERAMPAAHGELACAACGSSNDHDAMFCKRCGGRMQSAAAAAGGLS